MVRVYRQLLRMSCVFLLVSSSLLAQSSGSQAATGTTVPMLVKFSGALNGAPSRLVGITFGFYRDPQGGAPLWLETQSVRLDATGHYAVQLGSTQPNGVPKDLFASGDARWLGVRAEGQAEQPRVLLLSVPYALKAADAETLGGLPASAFARAITVPVAASTGSVHSAAAPSAGSAPPTNAPVTGLGTVNFVPLWDATNDIVNSAISQTGTGTTAKIGINTTVPTVTLDVKGASTIRGALTLPSTGAATVATGKNSQPLNLSGSAFNSGTSTAVNQTFRLMTEPVGNDTTNSSGKLSLLYYSGANTAAETGLSIASNGRITFADGQTFPGAGTISGVSVGPGLIGGGTSGNVSVSLTGSCGVGQVLQWTSVTWQCANFLSGLTAGTDVTVSTTNGNATVNLDTTKIPQLNVSNTFVGDQAVSGNLRSTGLITGSGFQIGSNLFAFGSYANLNAFLGFSGNATMTGGSNTASGYGALSSNTTGLGNTASGLVSLTSNTTGQHNTGYGLQSLFFNTTGGENTATGADSLPHNTTGSFNTVSGELTMDDNTSGSNNTAVGAGALFYNVTGSNNSALGYNAGVGSSNSNLTNASAIGANAEVDESNAIVLGSINGVNNAAASTNVGIGTTAPAFTLDVHGTGNFTGPITFAAGQTFPGAGTIFGVTAGTGMSGGGTSGNVTLNVDTTKVVTGVTAGTGLTGGGTGGVPTLSLDTTKIPQLNATNTFTGDQTTNGNLSATGVVSGSSYQIGTSLFAFGDSLTGNSYLGFAGSTSSGRFVTYNTGLGLKALFSNTGANNTAEGAFALYRNTLGNYNTAIGEGALPSNSTGSYNTSTGASTLQGSTGDGNTADGFYALGQDTTGTLNTGVGYGALNTNLTGSNNTALGNNSGPDTSHTNLNNSTAIGANALVAESNALVLGSINGVNNATASTNVGIGTSAPSFPLHVERNDNTGAGVQVVAENQSTSGASFAVFNATSDSGVTAEMVADGIGTGPLHTPGGYFGTYTNQPIGLVTANVERLHITAAGLVGVGTSAPTHPFQVAQGLGSAFADSWSTYSSRRWKTNIQTLPNALSKVQQLRGVSYELKGSGKHEIGVIAEEVGQVVPEVVSFEANGKDAQGVDYSRLTALLIEAAKQQQREIQALRVELRKTRQSLQQVKVRLAASQSTLEAKK